MSRSSIIRQARGALVGLFALTSSLAAQGTTGRIEGVVRDSAGGQGVTAVQVSVTGTRFGVVTQPDGRFVIAGLPVGTYTVETRRVGYSPARRAGVVVRAGEAATLELKILATTLRLQETVITGVVDPTSGTKVPFTVGKLDIADAPVAPTNAIQALAGKVAGVNVTQPGQPGSGINVVLRTPASISKANAPLIVVDGVILASTFGASTADLNALDIESIEVVKGAAAASLYGSRAANGVIQIRTQRGRQGDLGRTVWSLHSEYGQNALARELEWAETHYYRTNATGQYVDANGTVVGREQRVARAIGERFQDVAYNVPVYDQVKEFFEPSDFSLTTLNVRQNGEKTNFFGSISRQGQNGVVLGNGGYNRTDFRVNLDHRPSDKLSFSLSAYHLRSKRDELDDDTFFDLIHQAPDVSLRTPDSDGTPFNYQPDPQGIRANPLYVLAVQNATTERARTLLAADARYSMRDWFWLDGNVSYDRSDRNFEQFIDKGFRTTTSPQGGPGNLDMTNGWTTALNASVSANFLQRFGDFTTRFTTRALFEREQDRTVTASGTDFVVAGVPDLSAAITRTAASSIEDIRANGYFFTGGLDWKGRVISDALLRRDEASLFGPDERNHWYYRGSVAWRLAEEPWWKWKRLDEFKLRISQGTAGGRPSFADQFETYDITAGGGLAKGTLGNRALKPEHATETEIGIDAIWDNKYSGQLSYARTKVVDQLIQIPLPGAAGYEVQWQNAGTLEGNTWEATFEAQWVRKPGFSWKSGFVIDRSRNEITEFDRSCFITQVVGFRCANETLGTMYGFTWLRNASQLPEAFRGSADQFTVNDDGLLVAVGPGGKYTDPNKWGTSVLVGTRSFQWGMPIPAEDATGAPAVRQMGDGNPDFKWGLTNNVSWKGFSLFTLVDMQVGGDLYNRTKQRMYQYARHADVDQVGKLDGEKKTVEYYLALYNGNTVNDWFIENGTYMRLRELSLKYKIPVRMLDKVRGLGTRDVSVGVVGRNLWTRTNYSGYDPEVGTPLNRIDDFNYPQFRTITMSIDITF